ncbi:leucine-rich repeat-containing protein (substrate of the Dot/Icm secretion system) (plasmid) [Legionella adelaidensis]|uniref:Leucine-rich repeat-containing protein (Substrate of the Dot/Icm secretion system) n=1 Tax=Legionella adelaidensis TaxID=45056 RepID=A0A0W0R5G7_9GAMM|nr:hypothetical protein [Legionella adelaidensis]KTC66323.1 leucine-rich repeat-containing protein (substrate of the Dot/Icm secretion system) [Legionella adelaidensis]VEH84920.1 leucine-rich repeat-containing protein (substrate of the Dot/Icm secretion system) [Legionella adelaidensis]
MVEKFSNPTPPSISAMATQPFKVRVQEELRRCREEMSHEFDLSKLEGVDIETLKKILSFIPIQVTKLNLSGNFLGHLSPQQFKGLIEAIPKHIRYLDLSNNVLNKLPAKYLLTIFSQAGNLKEIDVKENNLNLPRSSEKTPVVWTGPNKNRGMESRTYPFTRRVSQNPQRTISQLFDDLKDNNIIGVDLTGIQKYTPISSFPLERIPEHIRHISLRNNNLGTFSDCANLLGKLHEEVTSVDLTGNKLNNLRAEHFMAAMKKLPTKLESLKLDLGDFVYSTKETSDIVKNLPAKLKTLTLHINKQQDTTIAAVRMGSIFEALNPCVTSIALEGESLSHFKPKELLEAFRKIPSTVQNLYIDDVRIPLSREYDKRMLVFDVYLSDLKTKALQFEDKATAMKKEGREKKYHCFKEAGLAAKKLYTDLRQYKEDFIKSPQSKKSMEIFRDKCLDKIYKAEKSVLADHRGIKGVLLEIVHTLTLLFLPGIIEIFCSKAGFFSAKTDSAKKIDALKKSVNDLSDPEEETYRPKGL